MYQLSHTICQQTCSLFQASYTQPRVSVYSQQSATTSQQSASSQRTTIGNGWTFSSPCFADSAVVHGTAQLCLLCFAVLVCFRCSQLSSLDFYPHICNLNTLLYFLITDKNFSVQLVRLDFRQVIQAQMHSSTGAPCTRKGPRVWHIFK